MESKLWAKDMFLEYKRLTHTEAVIFSRLRTDFPTGSFPKHESRLRKAAVLAVFWARTATTLCGGKVDYMAEWRAGRI